VESYGVVPERIHILPYVAPKYIYSHKTPDHFDNRYNLPEKFIFYPAQFWEHKNHKRLILAMGMLKDRIPDIKLVLVGSKKNAYRSTVKLAKDLNVSKNVIFLGYVPDEDLPEMYRRARALIMPTFFGPTNIPPLGAFAIGCPTAISGIYGIPGQVGDAAILFNPESVEEIAECIKRLWFDDGLCAALVKKGKEKAAKWGQQQFNDRLREIIEQIAG
jgi:glycosyltransferase involved in cell wall biosynthesis